ncbi:hypothetical protein [uncultured Methanoregula sp.]|uniref:hypothetical protein n=1 Tax=uncultured Methanoregula sp. TaxID=1005933 RepID=UPI002AAB016D|nr:hypothetical protein [uncultured Methanoregula sp.]
MQKLRALASDHYILIIAALVLIAVYLIDTITPLGEPVWVLYFIPLTLSYWSRWRYAIPTICIVTLLFISAGFIFSPPGVSMSEAFFNRLFFSVIFIGYSIIFMMIHP